LISWLFSPDFLILVTLTLIGFLIFLFFRFNSTKRLRKDDPDFLLRDISKSLSSNDSVEMISGNKTTFVSLDNKEINQITEILDSTPEHLSLKNENFKQSIKLKIYRLLKLPFLKKETSIPVMEENEMEQIETDETSIPVMEENEMEQIEPDEISIPVMEENEMEQIDIEEKSIDSKERLENLSQIELPFFQEEEKSNNLLNPEEPLQEEALTYDEIFIPKDLEGDKRKKTSAIKKLEIDEVLFSFSAEQEKNSEPNDYTEKINSENQIKDNPENSDEIFDVLNENVEIERENKKAEVDFSSKENPVQNKDYESTEEIYDSISELDVHVNEEEILNTSKIKFDNMSKIQTSLETICEDLYLSVEKPSKKLSEYDSALLKTIEEQITQLTDDGKNISSNILLRYAITCMYKEEYGKATSILKETLLKTEQLGYVLNALAVASFARNNLESSITYSLEALRECGDDRTLKDIVSSNIGYFYLQKGELEKALKSYLEILDEANLGIETSLLPSLHLRVGKIFNSIGDKDQARHHLTEAIQLSQGKGNELIRIQSLVALASSQTKSGSIEASLKSLEEALRISQLIKNREQEALIQGHMGLAFTAKDQFSKALLYHKKAVEIYKEIYNVKGEASNLASISNIYYFQDNLDEAQYFCEKALDLSFESNNLHAIGQNLTKLGRIFFEKNEWVLSCEKLSEARNIYTKLGDFDRISEIEGILNIAKSNDKKEEVF